MPKEEMSTEQSFVNFRRKLTLLRIMKAIKKRQAQLSQLPSYFFKNILFKLCDRYSSESDWDRANLVKRLVVLGYRRIFGNF